MTKLHEFRITTLIFPAAFVAAGLFAMTPAYAAPDDLIVEFQASPLFSEANFLPGSDVSRWGKVTNNTPDTRPIAVEAINTNDPDGLGDVLEIGIFENGVQRYATTTVADFFDAGEVVLSSIAGNGGNTQYDFVVAFKSSAGDPYQGKSVGFDILIGFQGDGGAGNGDGGEGGGNGGGGGGGGGGGSETRGLSILDERIATTTVTETTAVIKWTTSYRSTSRVVYGTTIGAFDYTSPPNYGYSFSSDEIDAPAGINGVLNHSVTLTGLTPGTTYYFRTISHASPDTVGYEYSFTTASAGSGRGRVLASEVGPSEETRTETGEKTTGTGTITPRETGGNQVNEGEAVGTSGTEPAPPEPTEKTKAGPREPGDELLAAIWQTAGLGTGKPWIGIIIAIIIAVTLSAWYIRRRHKT